MSGRAVVVGAGAIGIASAYYLSKAGLEVTVVDRGEVGRACSFGNACLIVPSHSDPIPGPGVIGQAIRWMLRSDSPFYVRPRIDLELLRWSAKFRRYCTREAAERGYDALVALSRASLELYEELIATKEAAFFYERRGVVEAYLSPASIEGGKRERDLLEAHGFPARFLTRDEALELEPALSPEIAGGLFIESEAHGYSYGYVTALARAFERHGGRILTGRPVEAITRSGKDVTGVRLAGPTEELQADVVVLAAGSWSRELARGLGLDIPLQPAKGYSATIDTYGGAPRLPILIKERRVIVTPLDDRLRFGGTLELAGFDETIDSTRYGAVVRAGREVLRVPPPMKNEEPWSGLRPVTPDGLPIIDRLESPRGLIVATGHAMLGFTQSPMTGKLVAELATGAEPTLPLTPYRLARF